MGFLPFIKSDGTASEAAMFVNTVLLQGLYNSDQSPFDSYAAAVGGEVKAFNSNVSSYNPDYGAIAVGNQLLIVIAGTTNIPQWAYHTASAFFPAFDPVTNDLVVGSFWAGEQLIEDALNQLCQPFLNNGVILIAGHSYGAAAAYIFATHLVVNNPNLPVFLMTFGEPYTYGQVGRLPSPAAHLKIVACLTDDFIPSDPVGIDPVTLSPPGILQFFKFAQNIPIFASLLGLKWKASGTRQILTANRLYPPYTSFDPASVPFVAEGQLVINLPYVNEHFVNPSYESKALNAYQRGPAIPQIQPLINIALQNLLSPTNLPTNLAPPVPATTINAGWGLPANTITEANRTDFSTVSLAGQISFPGDVGMPLSPYVQPTFKGTLFFDQDGGGSTESFFAAPPNTISPTPSPSQAGAAPSNYSAMQTAMQQAAQSRLRLSQTQDNPLCNNPLKLVAIRVENELVNRDSLLVPNPGIFGPGYTTGASIDLGAIANENDAINAAYKCNFVDGNGHTAPYYFHGVPIFSQNQPGGSQTVPPLGFEERLPAVRSTWIQYMWSLCNTLIQVGLGFRFQWICWTPGGLGQSGYPGTGNGTPLGVYYNFPGKPTNTYTFQMPVNGAPPVGQPPAALCQNPLGKFRIIVRSMKQLKVVNGRWPAFGFMWPGGANLPPAGYYVNVLRKGANYLADNTGAYDGYGYLSPEVWSVTQPAPSPPWVTTAAPGIQGPLYTTKRVGRPFDLERGRRRNQVT
jgi:hypothetical protein